MSSTNSAKSLLLTIGGILVLALMAAAAIRSGRLPDFVDLNGFIFVLVGGIALVMVSFSGDDIKRALMQAVGDPGNDAGIRISALFWEATARNFWILGGVRSVMGVILGFEAMKTEESAGVLAVINSLTRSLLGSFYGILLAVICLIPCWKLMAKLQSRPKEDRSETPPLIGRSGLRYGAVAGYILFLLVFALTIPNLSMSVLWHAIPSVVYWPSALVVLGGVTAMVLFMGGVNAGLPLSTSFAFMGLIGFLIALIQMLLGMGSSKIVGVASAVVFVLSSCFAAQLGMVLVGAPFEDHAVRKGQVAAPSPFSRASWYGFPLLTLVLVPLVIVLITTPMPRNRMQVTEVSAPVLEQRARFQARPPQSEPVDFTSSNIEKSHLLYKVNPVYPEQAKREGIQGNVKLIVIINEEGFVYEASGKPGNNPVLEKAAIPAVKRWRFSPFLLKGVPIAIETTATVNFALK